MGDEVAVRGRNAIFFLQINGAAHFSGFLTHCRVVVAREFALLEEDARLLFQGAALQHIGVKPL